MFRGFIEKYSINYLSRDQTALNISHLDTPKDGTNQSFAGDFSSGKVDVVRGEKNVGRLILAVALRARKTLCSYSDSAAPSIIVEIRENYDLIRDLRARGVRVRYITEITKENASYCTRMMSEIGAELRHIDSVRGNFTVTDTEYISIPQGLQEGKIPQQLIYSDLPELVEQNQFFFETLWSSAVPAEE
jgi:hypothetical protein